LAINIQQAKPPGFRKLKLVMKVIIFHETGYESKNLFREATKQYPKFGKIFVR
jgi:hypothetical protein